MKNTAQNLIGQKFGKWTVIAEAPRPHFRRIHYQCQCDCGREKVLDSGNLVKGLTTQCKKCSNIKHGKSHTKEYHIWKGLYSRCYNPHKTGFQNYGGRGIRICERWRGSTDLKIFLWIWGLFHLLLTPLTELT